MAAPFLAMLAASFASSMIQKASERPKYEFQPPDLKRGRVDFSSSGTQGNPLLGMLANAMMSRGGGKREDDNPILRAFLTTRGPGRLTF